MNKCSNYSEDFCKASMCPCSLYEKVGYEDVLQFYKDELDGLKRECYDGGFPCHDCPRWDECSEEDALNCSALNI